MAEIGIHAVGINPYATSESNLVRMYTTNGSAELLSLGQLVSAVMLRAAAAYEARAVHSINVLNANTSLQCLLAFVAKRVCTAADLDTPESEKITWGTSLAAQVKEFNYHPKSAEFAASMTVMNFLVYDCKIPASALPKDLTDFQYCIEAYEQIRPVMEEMTRASSLTEVEMQSAVSRRDVTYTTSANLVKAITGSSLYAASALRG